MRRDPAQRAHTQNENGLCFNKTEEGGTVVFAAESSVMVKTYK